MKKFITCILLLFSAALQPAFAEAPKEEPMSEAYKEWEQENAGREVAEESRYGELWSKTLMMLVIVLLVLFAGTYYLKRFGGNFGLVKASADAKTARILLLEKKVISPKAVVYLLSIDGHKIALSETSTGIQVLKPFEAKGNETQEKS